MEDGARRIGLRASAPLRLSTHRTTPPVLLGRPLGQLRRGRFRVLHDGLD